MVNLIQWYNKPKVSILLMHYGHRTCALSSEYFSLPNFVYVRHLVVIVWDGRVKCYKLKWRSLIPKHRFARWSVCNLESYLLMKLWVVFSLFAICFFIIPSPEIKAGVICWSYDLGHSCVSSLAVAKKNICCKDNIIIILY